MSHDFECKLTLYCDEPDCDRSDFFVRASDEELLNDLAIEEGWVFNNGENDSHTCPDCAETQKGGD